MDNETIDEETREVWRRRAIRLAQRETSTPDASETDTARRYLMVAVGEERFGIPVSNLLEVLPAPEATPVPEAPAALWGLIAMRGDIYPAFDAGLLLSAPEAPSNEGRHVVLLRGEGSTAPAALRVDRAEHIVTIPAPDSGSAATGGPVPQTSSLEGLFVDEIAVLPDGTSLNLLSVDSMLASLRGESKSSISPARKDVL